MPNPYVPLPRSRIHRLARELNTALLPVLALAVVGCSDAAVEDAPGKPAPSAVVAPPRLPDPATQGDDGAIPDGPSAGIEVVATDARGVPTFITGPLGQLNLRDPATSAVALLRGLAAERLGGSGVEDMVKPDVAVDEGGGFHIRAQQQANGRLVVGAELVIHADRTGKVTSYNGSFQPDDGWDREPVLAAGEALDKAIAELALPGAKIEGQPELVYVVSQVGYGVSLAYRALVTYDSKEDGPQADYLFADSQNGVAMARYPTLQTIKHWSTYNGGASYTLPGTLACADSAACGTGLLQTIHNNVSTSYDYFKVRFNRDSINAAGVTITATGNHGVAYNNAFWNGSQLAFGNGDGSLFAPLGGSLDVVAHELMHGITQNETSLAYYGESGALNEGLSDVFGAAAEAYATGSVNANTWRIGEAVYTPGNPSDALRYMNNPALDGVSHDYYPQRYTGTADNGGVHWNSGIVNLAFYLLSQGGSHPSGLTSNVVTGLGIGQAEQIFYRAVRYHYITSTTNLQGARNATALAAYQLYGKQGYRSTHQAWCAVGVPGCPAYQPISKTYTGDFDGDGKDELLVVYPSGLMNLYKFVGTDWQCLWTNNGNPSAGGGIFPYRNNLVIGDFDGNGTTDLLGSDGGWITMFHFYGGDWHWGWSNYGNPAAGGGIYPYRNNLIAGDFDGNGTTDLFGGGGWLTMFHFYGGDWHWGWSNYGNTSAGGGIYPYRNNLHAGDFDGNGTTDFFGVGGSWLTMFHYYGGDWHWGWSNYGNTSAGGGIYPYRNAFVVADYNGDGTDDILGTGGWITMFHYYAGDWHWGWSNYGSTSAGNGIYPYRNRLVPGHYDGNSRARLLGVNTWNTMFSYQADNDFHWGWSDYGDSLAFSMCY